MDSRGQFCHNVDCSARGLIDRGNIGVHSRQEGRYICHVCGKTFRGDDRDCVLPAADGGGCGDGGPDPAQLWLPAPGDRGRLWAG